MNGAGVLKVLDLLGQHATGLEQRVAQLTEQLGAAEQEIARLRALVHATGTDPDGAVPEEVSGV